MMNPSGAEEQHLRQLSIICFAFLSGVVILAGVVWFLLYGGGFTPPEGIPTYFATLFYLVALVAIVKAFFLPRLFPLPPSGGPEESRLAWHKRNTILGFALREGGAFIA